MTREMIFCPRVTCRLFLVSTWLQTLADYSALAAAARILDDVQNQMGCTPRAGPPLFLCWFVRRLMREAALDAESGDRTAESARVMMMIGMRDMTASEGGELSRA